MDSNKVWLCIKSGKKYTFYPLDFNNKGIGIPVENLAIDSTKEEMWNIASHIYEAPSLKELDRAVLIYRKGIKKGI